MSHETMSAGRLFHNRAPAVANVRSPTVAHLRDFVMSCHQYCHCQTLHVASGLDKCF